MSATTRKDPTPLQKKKLQQESESRCPFCGNDEPSTWDFHHIDGDRSHTALDNLILICGACHKSIDKGVISEADVRLKKTIIAWEAKNRKKNESSFTKIKNSNIASGNQNCTIEQNIYAKTPASPKVAPAPDSIGGNAKHKNYAFYLVGKLIEYRIKGKVFSSEEERKKKSKSISIAVWRKVNREFHVSSYGKISIGNSEKLFRYLQDLIDNTKQERMNRGRGYHSYISFENYNG